MLNYYSWTLYEYPEDPLQPSQRDADASIAFEDFSNELQALIHTRASHHIEMLLQVQSELPLPTSLHQRFRFWFLLGRAHIVCRKWDEALTAFTYCQSISMDLTDLMQIHLLRSWAYAAQEAHQHEIAFAKYERLAEFVVAMLKEGRQDFIAQDAHSFLCNIYRNQAYTRWHVCAPGAARAILEQDAMPLLDRYDAPFDAPARNPDETLWRELHISILWLLGLAIIWQARLSDEPRLFDQDLFDAYEGILIAARISQVFPEGQATTAELYVCAAEMCLMRCELANNRGMQTMLCDLAESHLKQSLHYRQDDLTTPKGRLHALTLDFPRYQLEIRKHILFDTVDRMDDTIADLVALRQRTEAVPDHSYRVFTARCLLLLGDVEIALQEFAAADDVTHAQRADAYLQQGLDLLDQRSASQLDGLYEREILKKREYLKRWLG